MKENKPPGLSPKQTQAIDDIIRSANPLFFGKLSRLLDTVFPTTREEKEKLLRHILKVWQERAK